MDKNVEISSRAVKECRICGSERLRRYLDLGSTPLANSYLAATDIADSEFMEELTIQLCLDCGLSQLTKVVSPDRMFRNYLYVSSTTATIREHFDELAKTAARMVQAKPEDRALDIASNDGCFLKSLRAAGFNPIGVDPAENLAREANAQGLRTECAYWSPETAQKIVSRWGQSKIITAANVIAHVDDLKSFMKGVALALAPEGLFIIECPYVVDFIEKSEFDTAYHEHLSYMGISPLAELMAAVQFEIVDIDYFPEIHGGTIRVYCGQLGERKISENVAQFKTREEKFGIKDIGVYDKFARCVMRNRDTLRALVSELSGKGMAIWAYGASAKGNTLMNFFGLKAEQIPIVIDDNPKKHGLLTPGARMEIQGISSLAGAKVDYLLLLAWNFEKEIRGRCRAVEYRGGFILPVPEARAYSHEAVSKEGEFA